MSGPPVGRARPRRPKGTASSSAAQHLSPAHPRRAPWGTAGALRALQRAPRLALTGTPFRSDTNPIPFLTYAPGPDGVPVSRADHTYGYADALRDGVVRPVIFLAYSGEMRWRTRAGDQVAARLGTETTRDLAAQAWRTALARRGSGSRACCRQRTPG